jgi:hypothetical protein
MATPASQRAAAAQPRLLLALGYKLQEVASTSVVEIF